MPPIAVADSAPVSPLSTKSQASRSLKKRATVDLQGAVFNEKIQGRDDATLKRRKAAQREACECFRTLCFGRVGNENWASADKEKIFEQNRGTEEEVQQLVDLWFKMDTNQNGEVSMDEFHQHFEASIKPNVRAMGARSGRYLEIEALQRMQDQSNVQNPCRVAILRGSGFGFDDMYCTAEIVGKPRSKMATRVSSETDNPVWNQTLHFKDYAEGDEFLFKVWAKDTVQDRVLDEAVLGADLMVSYGFHGDLPLSGGDNALSLEVDLSGDDPFGAEPGGFQKITSTGSVSALAAADIPCHREDLLRLLWSGATDKDLAEMSQIFFIGALRLARAPAPPLMSNRRLASLEENFRILDRCGTGSINYEAMVNAGFIDNELMKRLKSQYDTSGDGKLCMQEFLEMSCPAGSRPNSVARTVVTKDGQTLSLLTADFQFGGHFSGWFFKDDLVKLPRDIIAWLEGPNGSLASLLE